MILYLLFTLYLLLPTHSFTASQVLTVPNPTAQIRAARILAVAATHTNQPRTLSTNNANSNYSYIELHRHTVIQQQSVIEALRQNSSTLLQEVNKLFLTSLAAIKSAANTQHLQVITFAHIKELREALTKLDITAKEFAALAKCNVQHWRTMIDNYIAIAKEEFETNNPGLPLPTDFRLARLKEIMYTFGGYTFEPFRLAVKGLAEYDTAVIQLAHEIATNPHLKEEFENIHKKAATLKTNQQKIHDLFTKKSSFNLAQHITDEAAQAQKRVDTTWAQEQQTVSSKTLTQEALPTIQEELKALNSLTAPHYLSPAVQQRYERLQRLFNNVHIHLPKICDTTRPNTIYKHQNNPHLQTGFALLQHQPDSSKLHGYEAPGYNLLHLGHFVGRQELIPCYQYGMALIEEAGKLVLQSQTIPDVPTSNLVKHYAKLLAQTGARACQCLQDGLLQEGLSTLHASIGLLAQEEALRTGDSMQALQNRATQIMLPINNYTLNPEHEIACPGACDNQLLHQQERLNNHQIVWARRLEVAAITLKNCRVNIETTKAEFTAQEQEFMLAHGLSPITFNQCTGHLVQQAFHHETVHVIKQAAALHSKHQTNADIINLTGCVAQFSQQAWDAVARGNFIYAADLMSMSNALLDMASIAVLLPQHHQPTLTQFILQGVPHVPQMAQALVYGVGEGAAKTVEGAHYIATHKVETGLNILNALIKVGDTLALWDDGPNNLARRPLTERIAISKANVEAATAILQNLAEWLINSTPEERAYAAGEVVGQCIVLDGTLRMLTVSARVLEHTAPLLKARGQEALMTNFNAAHNAFITAVGVKELEAFNFIKNTQVAGTKIKVPLAHFNEQLMQKMETEAAKNVGKGAKIVASENTSAARHIPQSINVAEALKNIPATCAGLDASVGNIAKLEKALEAFKELPSAISSDGPIARLIKLGNKGALPGQLNRARGSAYELEKAYDLLQNGEKVIELGSREVLTDHITGIKKTIEVDIKLLGKYVECKNWDWAYKNIVDIDALKKQLITLKNLAEQNGKLVEFFSKNQIPQELKNWLNLENIKFIEG